ncbi:MAG: hypothetical protein WCK46_01335 [Candidatus Adlerbacteria bacterium]
MQKVLRCAVAFFLLVVVFSPALAVLGTPTTVHAQQGQGADPNAKFCDTTSTCLTSVVYLFTVYWTSGLVYVGSYVFNFGLQLGLNSSSYALDFLSQGWAVVRDIANLAFVFILIYIAYTIIVQAETSGTMKTLAMVIVMALLINFSFFLTRIVIDTGNILAIQFYNAIDVRDPQNPRLAATIASPLGGNNNPVIKDMSAGIMNAVQIQNLLGTESFKNFTDQAQNFSGFLANVGLQILLYTTVAIFFALIAFIFFSVGINFLIRIVTLWFVIIFAPLAFAARSLPQVKYAKKYYDLWQQHLVESAFYPAIFLFMFFIITLFLKELAGSTGLIPEVFKAAQGTRGYQALFIIMGNVGIRVGLLIVMMFYALKFSDSFSSQGSAAVKNIGGWAGSKAAQIGAGTSAWAARNTAGRAANALSRTNAVQNFAANYAIGRGVKNTLTGIAGSSMDIRGVSGLKSVLGKVNIDAGKAGGKGGFAKKEADRAKRIEADAKDLKGDAVDIDKAQKKHEADYDRAHNKSGAYKENLSELKGIKNLAEALAKTGATKEERDENKKIAKETGEKIKKEEEFGKKKIETLNTERLNALANRLGEKNWQNLGTIPLVRDTPILNRAFGPSRGSIEGALKVGGMTRGKNPTETLRDALQGAGIVAPAPAPVPPPARAPLTKTAILKDAQRPGGLGTAANTEITDSPIFREIASRLRETNRLEKAQLTEEQEQTRLAREGKKALSSIQTQKSRESTPQQVVVEQQKNPTRQRTPVDKGRVGAGFITDSRGLAPTRNDKSQITRGDMLAIRNTLERIRRNTETKPETPSSTAAPTPTIEIPKDTPKK